MYTHLPLCQLCLLLLIIKTVAQDPRFQTPDGGEHRTRRKPKWSHFFVMREPRSEEKDQAQGFFYQVGMGPPVINRLRSSPSIFQTQLDSSNIGRQNPAIHSPYPNRHLKQQQFDSRMPGAFGARMPSLQSSPLFNKPLSGNTGGGTLISSSETLPEIAENFRSGAQENFPENGNGPKTPHDIASQSGTEVSGMQTPMSSHATLLVQGNKKHVPVPDDSFKDSQASIKGKPPNFKESPLASVGRGAFGMRPPVPSHLIPVIPPIHSKPEGIARGSENSDNENGKLRLSIAQHIPGKTGSTHLILDQDFPGKESFGLRVPDPDNDAKTFFNRDAPLLSTEILKTEASPEKDYQGNNDRKEATLVDTLPEKQESFNPSVAQVEKQAENGGWQLRPRMNLPNQDSGSEFVFEDPQDQLMLRADNQREREPVKHDFDKPLYQTQHESESSSPHLVPRKYNYLPLPPQHHPAQANNPPNVNFNTNIHVHASPSPPPPTIDHQQEKPNQPSHSLAIHPYILRTPDSSGLQTPLQKDDQSSGAHNERIPSSQIYFLRPSNAADIPLLIAQHQNGPYRQDNIPHLSGQTSLVTSRPPSHLTAILPLSTGQNANQEVSRKLFTSSGNGRTPNVDYSEILLRNLPQGSIAPSVNPTNTGTHSIRLLLPRQQETQFSESPAAAPPNAHHVVGTPNRFQTHQVSLPPNSHGYVQTQVQLPPLNFRFRLTPVKDDSNGSFIDGSNGQNIAQTSGAFGPGLQPIPYQLPLQPVDIQGTHQILFPNFQISNAPTGISTVSPDKDQVDVTEAREMNGDTKEKFKPSAGPSKIEGAVDKSPTSKEQTDNKVDGRKATEDQILVKTVITDEINTDVKGRLLDGSSLPNDLPNSKKDTKKGVKEDTEKGVKEETEKGVKDGTEKGVKEETEKGVKDDTEKGIKKDTEEGVTEDKDVGVKGDIKIKFFKPEKTEKSTTPDVSADVQLNSSVEYTDEKKVTTTDEDSREVTTQSQFSTKKPGFGSDPVMTFTEAAKIEKPIAKSSDDATIISIKLEEKKHLSILGLETLSPPGDSTDQNRSDSRTDSDAPITITTKAFGSLGESTTTAAEQRTINGVTATSASPSTIRDSVETKLESQTTPENAQSSTETTATTVASTIDISLIRTETEIVIELPETSSESVTSTVSSTDEAKTSSEDKMSSTSLAESSTTELAVEVVTTVTTTAVTSAGIGTDHSTTNTPFQTDSNVKTTVLVLKNLEETTATSRENEMNQTKIEVSSEQTSATTDAVENARQEDISFPDTSLITVVANTSETDAANEIEQFFTSPAVESHTTATASIVPITTEHAGGKFKGFNELSVFTFTEPPTDRRKTKIVIKGGISEEKSDGSQSSNETTSVKTTVKESKDSLNEIAAVSTTSAVEDDKAEAEGTKLFGKELTIVLNETKTDSKNETTIKSEDGAIFTFVEKTVSRNTEEKTEFSVASSTSTSTEYSTVTSFTEIIPESTSEAPASTTNTKIDSNQNRTVVDTDSESNIVDVMRVITDVLSGRERNENEEVTVERGTPSNQTTEDDSDAEVLSPFELSTPDTNITAVVSEVGKSAFPTETQNMPTTKDGDDFTTVDPINDKNNDSIVLTNTTVKAGDNEVTRLLEAFPTETQNMPTTKDGGDFITVDPINDKNNDSTVLTNTTVKAGDNEVTRLLEVDNGSEISDGASQPMIIDSGALELLLNNLVTPINISILAPVTSTSISMSMGIPSESPEQILNEEKQPPLEKISAGQNNEVLRRENMSAIAVENEGQSGNTSHESGNGPSFFSKVFEKSLAGFPISKPESSENSVSDVKTPADESEKESQTMSITSTEKSESESRPKDFSSVTGTSSSLPENTEDTSSQADSSSATEAPNSLSETQATSALVLPQTQAPVSDRSAVKLAVAEDFDEGKALDIPDFTEISKQHAR